MRPFLKKRLRAAGLTAFLAAIAFAETPEALALSPGMKTPDIHASKWHFKDSQPAQDQAQPKTGVDVVVVFDAIDPGSGELLRMLEALRDVFPAGQLASVKAVARNTQSQLEELLKRNGDFKLPIAVDTEKFDTAREFCDMEPVLPMAFVSFPDGALAWSGGPTGLESVVRQIASKTFDLDKQKRIAPLRTELQTALRGGLGAVALKNADRILSLDPSDMMAIQAKLFVFDSQGHPEEAKPFLLNLKAQAPKDQEIRLLLLGFLIRAGDLEAFKAEAVSAREDLKGDARFASKLCAFLLDSSPFGALPLELAISCAKEGLDALSPESSKDSKAFAYELYAKASYYSGKLDVASDFQAKAVELRKGGPYETPAKQLLDYYKKARSL